MQKFQGIMLCAAIAAMGSIGCDSLSFGQLRSVLEVVPQKVTIIGTGYVGLVSGCVFSDIGYDVICADIDQGKITQLNQGIIPIVEKGLQRLLQKNSNEGRLSFTTDVPAAISSADIIFIAVGTPMSEDGTADMRALTAVIKSIAAHAQGHTIVCVKSTVPIGTAEVVREMFAEYTQSGATIDIVSNPEFLREGCALEDFLERNPIVIGSAKSSTQALMRAFYQPLLSRGLAYLPCNNITAETIKYGWNAFSATRIGYINQLSLLCDAVGADIFTVIAGVSFSDKLLPTKRIKPGPGYGGSCLPKDTNALVRIAEKYGIDLSIVRRVIEANEDQKRCVVNTLYKLLDGSVKGKHIAILGLSFKQDTDDIRYSPAINAIEQLLIDGADIYAYDPAGMEHMKKLFPMVKYTQNPQQAIQGADGILLLTPWDEFKQLDLAEVAQLMNNQVIVDGRNIWSPDELAQLGFTFANLGRQSGENETFRLN